eukprot:SM000207S06199  [mRNA]  locus=s207:100552:102275:- [translate_table: standard]
MTRDDLFKTNASIVQSLAEAIAKHCPKTSASPWSEASPHAALSDEEVEQLTRRTQDGGTEVVAAKAGKGSATLSMAYAGALFANSCLKGLNGEAVTEFAYVQSSVTDAPFFASKVSLGSSGVEEVHGLGELSDYEKEALKKVLPELKDSIEKGVKFVTG